MKIKIGDLDVLENGSLILIENQTLNFFFENSMFEKIRIEFTEEKTDDDFQFAKIEGDENLLLLIPKMIEKGLPQYLMIGIVNNRELLFNYNVTEIDFKNKIFNYIFLLGKNVESNKK